MKTQYLYKLHDSISVIETCTASGLAEALVKFGNLELQFHAYQVATAADERNVYGITWSEVKPA